MARWQAYRFAVGEWRTQPDGTQERSGRWVSLGTVLHAPDRRTAVMVSVDLWPDYWYTDALKIESVASLEAA